MGQMFKKAERRDAKLALIIGETELKDGVFNVKDIKTQEQITIEKEYLLDFLDKAINQKGHHHHDHDCCCGGECCDDDCDCEHDHHEHDCCCEHHHEE
jgi:hypothetical protein